MVILNKFNTLKLISKRYWLNKSRYRSFTSGPETFHSASPRLPLLYYKASKSAMVSMNHRVFYANWFFVFAAYDFLTTFVDF